MTVAATVIAIQTKHLARAFLGDRGRLIGRLLNPNGITWSRNISRTYTGMLGVAAQLLFVTDEDRLGIKSTTTTTSPWASNSISGDILEY